MHRNIPKINGNPDIQKSLNYFLATRLAVRDRNGEGEKNWRQ